MTNTQRPEDAIIRALTLDPKNTKFHEEYINIMLTTGGFLAPEDRVEGTRPRAFLANGVLGYQSIIGLPSNLSRRVCEDSRAPMKKIKLPYKPWALAYDVKRNHLLATNSDDSSLDVIELGSGRIVCTVNGLAPVPRGVAISETRDIALIPNEFNNTVTVVDLEHKKKVKIIEGLSVRPERIRVSEDFGMALVPNLGLDGVTSGEASKARSDKAPYRGNAVSVIDLDNLEVAKTIIVGSRPTGIGLGIDRALVGNFWDNTVSIIDLRLLTVIHTADVKVVTDEKSLKINIRPPQTEALTFEYSVAVPQTEGIAISQKHNIALVANWFVPRVTVIDLSNFEIVKRIPTETGSFDVVVDDELNVACVPNTAANTVTVISLNTLEPVCTLPVGKKPTDMIIVDGHAIVPVEDSIDVFPIALCPNQRGGEFTTMPGKAKSPQLKSSLGE